MLRVNGRPGSTRDPWPATKEGILTRPGPWLFWGLPDPTRLDPARDPTRTTRIFQPKIKINNSWFFGKKNGLFWILNYSTRVDPLTRAWPVLKRETRPGPTRGNFKICWPVTRPDPWKFAWPDPTRDPPDPQQPYTMGYCGSKTHRQETWQTIAQNVALYVLINAIVLVFAFMEPFGRNLNSKFCSLMKFWLSPRKLHLKISKNQEIFDWRKSIDVS